MKPQLLTLAFGFFSVAGARVLDALAEGRPPACEMICQVQVQIARHCVPDDRSLCECPDRDLPEAQNIFCCLRKMCEDGSDLTAARQHILKKCGFTFGSPAPGELERACDVDFSLSGVFTEHVSATAPDQAPAFALSTLVSNDTVNVFMKRGNIVMATSVSPDAEPRVTSAAGLPIRTSSDSNSQAHPVETSRLDPLPLIVTVTLEPTNVIQTIAPSQVESAADQNGSNASLHSWQWALILVSTLMGVSLMILVLTFFCKHYYANHRIARRHQYYIDQVYPRPPTPPPSPPRAHGSRSSRYLRWLAFWRPRQRQDQPTNSHMMRDLPPLPIPVRSSSAGVRGAHPTNTAPCPQSSSSRSRSPTAAASAGGEQGRKPSTASGGIGRDSAVHAGPAVFRFGLDRSHALPQDGVPEVPLGPRQPASPDSPEVYDARGFWIPPEERFNPQLPGAIGLATTAAHLKPGMASATVSSTDANAQAPDALSLSGGGKDCRHSRLKRPSENIDLSKGAIVDEVHSPKKPRLSSDHEPRFLHPHDEPQAVTNDKTNEMGRGMTKGVMSDQEPNDDTASSATGAVAGKPDIDAQKSLQ